MVSVERKIKMLETKRMLLNNQINDEINYKEEYKTVKKESVLCIYTQDAEKLELLRTQKRENILEVLEQNNHLFMFQSRSQIEENTNVIQIIPYILVENESGEMLLYKRNGSEKKLDNMYSIGVGGHININDILGCYVLNSDGSLNIMSLIGAGLFREIKEEIEVFGVQEQQINFLGSIYKTNSLVDLVHLGLVFKLKVRNSQIDINTSELKPVWASLSELKQFYPQLENWSKELYDTFLF